jgi:predicted MFS family arabinose efflux permease
MSSPDDRKPNAALTLAVFTGLNLLNYVDRYVLPSVATPLKAELGIDDEQYGRLAPAFMIGYFLTAPIFGALGDRGARKWLIALGVVVWSVGTMLSGWAHGLMIMLLFRVIVGVGEASYGTLSPGWIADLFPSHRRNNALALFYLAIPVGAALAFKLGGWMATSYGWRWAFMWAGVPGLALALAVLMLREPPRGMSDGAAATATPPAGGGMRGYLRLLEFKPYLLVVAGYVGYTFAMGGFIFWAAQFLERVHGMSVKAADDFFGLGVVVTGLAATPLGAWIATRWQKRSSAGNAWTIALSALLAVPTVYFAFASANLDTAKQALIISMFLLFMSTGPVNTVILESVPVALRASAMAASIFSIHLFGDLWSPWIVGALSVKLGSLQRAALWLMPGGIAVCAVFWCLLALTMRKPAERGSGL